MMRFFADNTDYRRTLMNAEQLERLETAYDMHVYADDGKFCEQRPLAFVLGELEQDGYSRDEIWSVIRALDSGRGVEVGEYMLWKVTK